MQKRTKFILAALAAASVAIAATVVGYQDWQVRGSAPSNPGTGYFRTWADNSSGLMKCITSTGSACFFNPPSSSPLVLQTNGSPNGSQALLNLHAGTNMTLTDNGSGQITFDSAGGGGLLLQTNTVNNGSQTLLNLLNGAGIAINDNGSGGITISTSAAGPMRALGMAFGMTSGSALTVGATQYVTVPFACTIKQWDLAVDAGTAIVDIWKIPSGPVDWALTSVTVNTSGTAVSWVSGTTFPADAAGLHITINGVLYVIATVNSSTSITLTTSAGTQSGVAFAGPGNAVPTITNTITASALPAISSGTATGSSTLTGWTTSVIKNDVIAYNLNAVSTAKALTIVLECQQ